MIFRLDNFLFDLFVYFLRQFQNGNVFYGEDMLNNFIMSSNSKIIV